MRYGTTPDRWNHYAKTLGLLPDLLPVVSNPDAPISPRSTLRALGKTPSLYNSERQATGIAEWTKKRSTAAQVARWAQDPDLGICVQTRRLRAIDIDVEDSGPIVEAMKPWLPADPLLRLRTNSGKLLIPFFFIDGALVKHVAPVAGGMVEILGDGQQFIAEGTHPSGAPYEWLGEETTTLDSDDLAALLAAVATGPVRTARRRQDLNGSSALIAHDEVADWLIDNWEIYDVEQDGRLYLMCPFADEHSSETSPTSTAYFPAGTGGYSDGSFVCLHAHCTGREQAEFLITSGYIAGQFRDLERGDQIPRADAGGAPDCARGTENNLSSVRADALRGLPEGDGDSAALAQDDGGVDARHHRQELIAAERWPRLKRDSKGAIEPTMGNLLAVIGCPSMIQRRVALDLFREELVWAPLAELPQWRPFKDSDYARLRKELEDRGFKAFGMEMLRLAVLTAAEDHAVDTAREWLSRLAWDGVPRVKDFAHLGWGWLPGAYAEAVSRYTWTALAGRIVDPGCQADMVPVLIGEQGIRKTSAIKAMTPDPEMYLTIKLDAHDDDSSRKLRGKLVVELEELRGLRTRAVEEIKAWITKTHEEWVPKFREFSTKFARRCLMTATTNDDEFLDDPTGERRWLPGRCGRIDVAWIDANRDQLWAEGAVLFAAGGVAWQDAERLAVDEHGAFKVSDAWEPFVQRWLAEDQIAGPRGTSGPPVEWPAITATDALQGAIGLPPAQIGHSHKLRMAKVFRAIGLRKLPKGRQAGSLIDGWAVEV